MERTDADVEELLIDRFLKSSLVQRRVTGKTVGYLNVNRENVSFKRPSDLYWFNLWFIPSMPQELVSFKSGGALWRGFLQIDICVPKNTGTKALNDRFRKVAECFPLGFIDRGVRILSVGRSVLQTNDDYSMLPVSVAWEAYLK